MDANRFRTLLQMAGGDVTILRPSTSQSFSVTMSSPTTVRDETLFLEAKQNDEQGVFSQLDFNGQLFTEPKCGDRITDVDGSQYSIEQIKKLHGMGRDLYGSKCRIRG